MDQEFQLFPTSGWFANHILKQLGYPSALEITGAYVKSMWGGIPKITTGNEELDAEHEKVMNNQAGYSDPVKDLEIIAKTEKETVINSLREAKQYYNEIFLALQRKCPNYIDLNWQIFRRYGRTTHFSDRDVDEILNPNILINEQKESPPLKYEIPAPVTDDERTQYAKRVEIPSHLLESLTTSFPELRLVEFDPNYFYGTGRFAFAYSNGNIFQTTWDVRKEQAPLFEIGERK